MNENSSYDNKFEDLSDAIFEDSTMDDEFMKLEEVSSETYYTPTSVSSKPRNQDEKTWFLLAHLSSLSSFIVPFGSLLGPFLVWQIKKDQMPGIVSHAKSALNFQITMALLMLVSIPLMFIGIGFLTFFAAFIGSLIFAIVNGIKAQNGESYKYPFSLNLIK